MLDELVLGGEMCETSKKNVLKAIAAQDLLQEVSYGDSPYEIWHPPTRHTQQPTAVDVSYPNTNTNEQKQR